MGCKDVLDRYPLCIFCILGNEFCERFSFYGMKAILVLYLSRALGYEDNEATAIYHGFNFTCYFMPIFGAMLADGVLGKYWTILSISIVYCIGNAVMALGAIPLEDGTYLKPVTFIGLLLIAIGTGGIKPCVSAFGGDQFEENQVREKETFFSVFYMAINLGSLISMIITPIIRSSVICFGKECYPLAFGIPAALMIVALGFFIVGSRWYKKVPPGESVITKLFGCIGTALVRRCKSGTGPQDHWLDYANKKYSSGFIAEVKALMRVLFMFIPLPVFWALFDQQGSRWTLQAGQMRGKFGDFTIEPDQIQVINPIFILTLVPLLESVVFPCFRRFNIPDTPLKRLGYGMFLAAMAFIVSAIIQGHIESKAPAPIKSGESRLAVFNYAGCDVNFTTNTGLTKQLGYREAEKLADVKSGTIQFEVTSVCANFSYSFESESEKGHSVVFMPTNMAKSFIQTQTTQTEKGRSTLQFINTGDEYFNLTVEKTVDASSSTTRHYSANAMNVTKINTFSIGTYRIKRDNYTLNEYLSNAGQVSTSILYYNNNNKLVAKTHAVVDENSVNIFLQIPQYFVMSLGEVFFSVTGLSFAYSQAPPTMKSVLQAAWLLTNALGNALTMVIALFNIPSRIGEYLLFSGLMLVTIVIFGLMGISYMYVDHTDFISEHQEEEEQEKDKEKVHVAYVNDAYTITPDDKPPLEGPTITASDTQLTAL